MSLAIQAALAGDARAPSFAELWQRMELEFELARARSAPAAFLRIDVERLDRLDAAHRSRALVALGARIAEHAPPTGLVAAQRDAELFVLLAGAGIDAAEAFARALIVAARRLVLDGESTPVRLSLSIGLAATRPGLDLYFEALSAVAGEGVSVARSNGGECCVHSELYELSQRKVERVKGPRTPVPAPAATKGGAHAPGLASANESAAAADARTGSGAGPRAGHDDPLLARVTELLPSAAALPGLDLANVEARMLELARSVFERALAEREERFQSELEVYQRRIAKMQRALSESELEKDRLAQLKGLDSGLASVYRDVQGLHGDERDFEHKAGLLRELAESNLKLREELQRKTA